MARTPAMSVADAHALLAEQGDKTTKTADARRAKAARALAAHGGHHDLRVPVYKATTQECVEWVRTLAKYVPDPLEQENAARVIRASAERPDLAMLRLRSSVAVGRALADDYGHRGDEPELADQRAREHAEVAVLSALAEHRGALRIHQLRSVCGLTDYALETALRSLDRPHYLPSGTNARYAEPAERPPHTHGAEPPFGDEDVWRITDAGRAELARRGHAVPAAA